MTRQAWRIASATFVLVALAALIESLRYGFLDRLGPGPGFFPTCISVVMGAVALALLWRGGRPEGAPDDADGAVPRGDEAWRVLRVLVGLLAALMLLGPLGFRLTMLLFLLYLPLSLGARSVWAISVLALAGSFGVFHVFYYWLRVPLPIGGFGI